MPWINSGELALESDLPYMENYWVYNGLDCCVTHEVYRKLSANLTPEAELIYGFERAMQWPAMDMMVRGVCVDDYWRAEAIDFTQKEKDLLESRLNRIAEIVWGQPLNARSPTQLKTFFKEWLRIPIPITRKKGEEKESLDRKALEKLNEHYFYAKPIISHILAIRDRSKTLGVLRTGVDTDGRIRTSYNVASTETGRWSSSENAFGTGTNLQNITERLRRILIADPGFKFAYIDLEQAEARVVALLVYHCLLAMEAWCVAFGLEVPEVCEAKARYLDACESGDLHTTVAMLTWPELPWVGSGPNSVATNREVADDHGNTFYRDFTHRDIAKRLGHGSNYRGSPYGIALVVGKIEAKIVEAFQRKYFAAFPLETWHEDVVRNVQLYGYITTPLGRKRQFFGRRNDDATHREAIAYGPQSVVGDLLNLGLYRVWRHYYDERIGLGGLRQNVQLLGQIHDAILIQYRDISPSFEAEVISRVSSLIQVPVTLGSRTLTIPSDCAVGWNASKRDNDKKLFPDGNPDGLIKYKGHDDRKRTKALSLLDRQVR